MISKWMRNFIDASSKGEPGKCPFCGSMDTDYVIVQDPAFIEVWCNTCKKMDNMSYRGIPKPGMKVMSGHEYENGKESRNVHYQ